LRPDEILWLKNLNLKKKNELRAHGKN